VGGGTVPVQPGDEAKFAKAKFAPEAKCQISLRFGAKYFTPSIGAKYHHARSWHEVEVGAKLARSWREVGEVHDCAKSTCYR
jgi:hypothetical protein